MLRTFDVLLALVREVEVGRVEEVDGDEVLDRAHRCRVQQPQHLAAQKQLQVHCDVLDHTCISCQLQIDI